MCGITGIINKYQKSPELRMLKRMADKISHRGPDDEGSFIENQVGFYHKRLSIIDIKNGRQPMTSGTNTIVFNGEIYNYVELRESLTIRGYRFKTGSDTEVILKMYEEYGKKCVELLNGMFAFVIYDKARSSIFIARDHFGIKPLYFTDNDDHFIFGSEIKAILEHPSVKAEPDYDSMNEYLTFQFVLGDKTLFKGIKKLLPGHYMTINLNSMQSNLVKYWEPRFSIDHDHTKHYFVNELKRLLDDTIRIQLRSDVPVGTYLSGGMDSSIITLISAKYLDNLQTFTGAFKESKDFDETEYAQKVAKKAKAKIHTIYPTASDFTELLPKLIYHLDEPVAGPGSFPQFMVSRLAKQNVTVALGGQGGDEIFGGYARYMVAYFEQAIKGAILETNEEGEHIVSLSSIIPNLPYIHRYIPMIKDFWSKGAFEEMDRRYFHLLDRSNSSMDYFTDDFKRDFDKEKVFGRFQEIFNDPDTKSYYNKMTHFDMFGSLPGLLQVEDRVSMAASLESRVPLLDRRIVDLISGVPAAMKFKGGEMKHLLKKAVKDLLPPSIFNRKDKMGFPVPLHIWMKNGEVSGFVREILQSQKARERGIFNPDKIDLLLGSARPYGRALWGLISLELWFNQFIDK